MLRSTSPMGQFKALAEETGGRVILNANDLVGELGRIAEDRKSITYWGTRRPNRPREAVTNCAWRWIARAWRCGRARVLRRETGVSAGRRRRREAGEISGAAAAAASGILTAAMQLPYFYASPTSRASICHGDPHLENQVRKGQGKPHAELRVTGVARSRRRGGGRFNDTVNLDFESTKESDAFAKQPYHYEYQFNLPPGQYHLGLRWRLAKASPVKWKCPWWWMRGWTPDWPERGGAIEGQPRRAGPGLRPGRFALGGPPCAVADLARSSLRQQPLPARRGRLGVPRSVRPPLSAANPPP